MGFKYYHSPSFEFKKSAKINNTTSSKTHRNRKCNTNSMNNNDQAYRSNCQSGVNHTQYSNQTQSIKITYNNKNNNGQPLKNDYSPLKISIQPKKHNIDSRIVGCIQYSKPQQPQLSHDSSNIIVITNEYDSQIYLPTTITPAAMFDLSANVPSSPPSPHCETIKPIEMQVMEMYTKEINRLDVRETLKKYLRTTLEMIVNSDGSLKSLLLDVRQQLRKKITLAPASAAAAATPTISENIPINSVANAIEGTTIIATTTTQIITGSALAFSQTSFGNSLNDFHGINSISNSNSNTNNKNNENNCMKSKSLVDFIDKLYQLAVDKKISMNLGEYEPTSTSSSRGSYLVNSRASGYLSGTSSPNIARTLHMNALQQLALMYRNRLTNLIPSRSSNDIPTAAVATLHIAESSIDRENEEGDDGQQVQQLQLQYQQNSIEDSNQSEVLTSVAAATIESNTQVDFTVIAEGSLEENNESVEAEIEEEEEINEREGEREADRGSNGVDRIRLQNRLINQMLFRPIEELILLNDDGEEHNNQAAMLLHSHSSEETSTRLSRELTEEDGDEYNQHFLELLRIRMTALIEQRGIRPDTALSLTILGGNANNSVSNNNNNNSTEVTGGGVVGGGDANLGGLQLRFLSQIQPSQGETSILNLPSEHEQGSSSHSHSGIERTFLNRSEAEGMIMELNTLVALLEDQKTWNQTNVYKEQLGQENTEIVPEIVSHLDTIIHGKKFSPFSRLGAVRLLKSCLEAGSEYFNFYIQDNDFLDKLAEFAKAKPSSSIFSIKPDKRETEISYTFFTYIVEGFLIWATWFPTTKFEELYLRLKQAGVSFPDVSKIFKKKQMNLYVNGEFSKKSGHSNANNNNNNRAQGTETGNFGDSQKPQQTAQGQSRSNKNQPIAITEDQIYEQMTQFETMKELMVEMLQGNDEPLEDFQMFTDIFQNFSKFSDSVFANGQQTTIDERIQEQLMDRSELCFEIQQLIDSFCQQSITSVELKKRLIQICNPKKNQQQSQQISQSQLPKKSQQQLQEEQNAINAAAAAAAAAEAQRQRDDEETAALEAQRRREAEEAAAEQEKLRIQRQREVEEQQQRIREKELKKQQEEQQKREEKERLEREHLAAQQLKKEQEEQRRQAQLQKEADDAAAAEIEEERRRIAEFEEEQRILQAQQQQNQKKNVKLASRIPEDQNEYDDEEESKSNDHIKHSKPNTNLNSMFNNNSKQPSNNAAAAHAKPSGSYFYQQPETAKQNNAANHDDDELVDFDNDDNFDDDYAGNHKNNHAQHQNQQHQYPKQQQQHQQQQQQHIPFHGQQLNANQQQHHQNQFHGFDDNHDANNSHGFGGFPDMSKKNPFQNQQSKPTQLQQQQQHSQQHAPEQHDFNQFNQPAPKGQSHYFVEEFYEAPPYETATPQTSNKQISNSQIKPQQQQQGSQVRMNTNSKLEQSGNIEDERGGSLTQLGVQHLNNTIHPKTKHRDEYNFNESTSNRDPAHPKNPVTSGASGLFSGFEQISFKQPSTLKSQIHSMNKENGAANHLNAQKDDAHEVMSQSKFQQALNDNEAWESKSQVRLPTSEKKINQSGISDSRRVPIFSKDKQSAHEVNDLRSRLAEMQREYNLETQRLKLENAQLNQRLKDKESMISLRSQEDGMQIRQIDIEKGDLERRLQEKDKVIYQQKKLIETQNADIEQNKSIMRQYEQQKTEQNHLLTEKKQEMDELNKRTRQQLQDYINSTQKSQNNRLEEQQRALNQLQLDAQEYQADLQQKELELSDLRSEVRLLKSKDTSFNQGYMKEKDLKIADLKSQVEVLNREIDEKEERNKEVVDINLSLRKQIEHLKEEIAQTESWVEMGKQNLVQKEIEISSVKQSVFEKDQVIYSKEQAIIALETALEKKKQIIDQFKGSSENQIKKFHENIENQEELIHELKQQNRQLEDRLENLSSQHSEEMNRIIQASKLSEEQKNIYKRIIEENGQLKSEKSTFEGKEKGYQSKIDQLQKQIAHLKKESEFQEQNLEDLVLQNNLITKKLYEKDELFSKETEIKDRDLELRERKFNTELKYTRQAMETLKLEKSRKETDLVRNIDTLRRENELLLHNLKAKVFVAPVAELDVQNSYPAIAASRSQQAFLNPAPMKYEIDRSSQDNSMIAGGQPSDRKQQPFSKAMEYSKSQQNFLGKNSLNPASGEFEDRSMDSVNNSGYSIRPKKPLVPKSYTGKQNVYNPTYFSYIAADTNQMYRFKKSCLKSKMAVYQDNYLNVGIITEAKEVNGKAFALISIFFENKSLNHPLKAVRVSYEADKSVNVYKKPTEVQAEFSEGSQHQQQILTDFLEVPFRIIQCTIQYTVNGKLNQAVFPLPNTINKFFTDVQGTTPESINSVFNRDSHLVECSEIIKVDKNVASSQYDYQAYFPTLVNLGASENLPEFQCIGGQYFIKNIDTNIWLKIHYNKKEHKALFQVVQDNQLEEYSQNAVKYLLQTLMMIFKE